MPDPAPWRIEFAPRALKQLRALPEMEQHRIRDVLRRLATHESNVDIRKLQGTDDEWAIRVGVWRVRLWFQRETHSAYVLQVLHRREAYRD